MAEQDRKDLGRTVVHRASHDDGALDVREASSRGGAGPDEKGPLAADAADRSVADEPLLEADRAAHAAASDMSLPTGEDASAGDAALPAFPETSEAALHELSRRERERLVRRQLMLDAARAVFAEKGYTDATLDEVAARAEFGKGTLYNYFEGGKEEILFAIFDDLYDALCRLVDATLSPELVHSSPFRQVFEGFLTAIFAFFLDRQDQFMILMKEGHRMMFSDQPEKARYFQKQGERVIDVMMSGIEAAQAKGELRPFPSIAIANMIMGNVKGYHMHRCMEGCRDTPADGEANEMPSPEESARFLSTFLLDGMLARPDARI